MRCFIALDIPLEARSSIAKEAKKSLGSFPARLRFVSAENLHLTLRFLGDIPESRVMELKKRLHEFRFAPAQLLFDNRITWFYNRKHGFPIFVPLLEGANIVKDICDRLMDHLFLEKETHFKPHLTVARSKETVSKAHLREGFEMESAVETDIEKIALYSSELTPKGPIYSVIEEIFPS